MSTSTVIRGKVWKFGDNVSTTDITPGEMFMSTAFEPRDITFAALRPDWRAQVRPGDCIVAGKNFGFGSHRAMANEVMKDLGVSCIVADSIARIYFRNAIAAGCVAISCPGVSRLFREGDELELNISLYGLSGTFSIKKYSFDHSDTLFDFLERIGFPKEYDSPMDFDLNYYTAPKTDVFTEEVDQTLHLNFSVIGTGLQMAVVESLPV